MKLLFCILGLLFVGLGALGALLPVLPTTPFLLLASLCFAKASQKLHDWLVGTRLYRKHLESYVLDRAMTAKTKATILAVATAMLLLAFLMMSNVIGRAMVFVVMGAKYYYFLFRIKTLPNELSSADSANDSVTIQTLQKRLR